MSLQDENIDYSVWKEIFKRNSRMHTKKVVGRSGGIVFEIKPKEKGHNEAHCHVTYQNSSCSISLESYKFIAGNLPVNKRKKALEWVKDNIEVLRKYWNEYQKIVI